MYEITDRYGTTNHEFTDYEILEKLGRAIYVHRALIKQAERPERPSTTWRRTECSVLLKTLARCDLC